MIDIHSHILPGLDDGAQDLSESIAMARMAQADGVKEIIATPHNASWTRTRQEEVFSLVKILQAELEAQGIEVRLVPGVEAYLVPNLARELSTGQAFTLDETRYLLVELPLSAYPVYTEQVIFELQVRGIVPILAHPERNVAFQEDVNLLFPLVERGVLTQLTAASLEGVFGPLAQETARIMLEHNLAHFIASDAHGLTNRTPVLSRGVEEAAKVIGLERARTMVEMKPAALLRDEEITTEPPLKYRPKRRWFWQR